MERNLTSSIVVANYQVTFNTIYGPIQLNHVTLGALHICCTTISNYWQATYTNHIKPLCQVFQHFNEFAPLKYDPP